MRKDAAEAAGIQVGWLEMKNKPFGYPGSSDYRAVALAIGVPSQNNAKCRFFRIIRPNTGKEDRDTHIDDLKVKFKIVKKKPPPLAQFLKATEKKPTLA